MKKRSFALPPELFLTALLIVLLTGGCATSHLPAEPAHTLNEVNRRLEERWATVEFADENAAEYAEDVQVGADTTTYYDRRERDRVRVATMQVCRVTVKKGIATRTGFLLGAAPGLVLVGTGVTGLTMGSVGGYAAPLALYGIPIAILGASSEWPLEKLPKPFSGGDRWSSTKHPSGATCRQM